MWRWTAWRVLLLVSFGSAKTVAHFHVLELQNDKAVWRRGVDLQASQQPNLSNADDNDLSSGAALGIPKIIHRSHKYSTSKVRKVSRLWTNVQSCVKMNPGYETRYYDDAQVNSVLQHLVHELTDADLQSALKRLSVGILSEIFVMRSDWFRLAILYLVGGWWLDGDVRCIDGIGDVLGSGNVSGAVETALSHVPAAADSPRCILAWEGELPQPQSSPLNWALGCTSGHPLLLHAMQELGRRVLRLKLRKDHNQFHAVVATKRGSRSVDVLNTTGPGMLGDALASFAGRDLRQLREEFGETATNRSTWDAISVIHSSVGVTLPSVVIMLPYCFFRSRGCPHLAGRFDDRVIFHHEFDTSWRQSFWHNYVDHDLEL